jgi:hypothetical protein
MPIKTKAAKQIARKKQADGEFAHEIEPIETESAEESSAPIFGLQQLGDIGRVPSANARQNLMRSIGETYGNSRAATIARQAAQAAQTATTQELSGAQWVSRYQDPRSLDALNDDFREDATAFVQALRDAGATVTINSTVRPPQRSYLMYWCTRIASAANPEAVAAQAQADTGPGSVADEIRWSHGNAARTKAAAQAMKNGYGIGSVVARRSNHNGGGAMDISISWSQRLTIRGKNGEEIRSTAASGVIRKATTSPDRGILAAGRSYGLMNYHDPSRGAVRGQDGVHWSRTGG